ncbi:Zn(2)-C6 fungal-type DNA-binding domain protein [Niveomyces insectorum RCEF 264]|uniref:Zn(2)-C6 fungal-type DNA-binding domain protein n=1 Tax=Niveomyces insectorum RCEF 264 TaxID=1081102 RepID=A0A167VR24_9HYPO|nr:Zn(2)-C6 fungal-type DNA-binding domain protein [Niveomyces insectorum RCEF 264]
MAAKPRSSDGCWTCRLRRKRCSETRPVCDECAMLEIMCYYSDKKPSWMDNGDRQKAMANRLKAEVKNRALWRREKRSLQMIETGTAAINLTAGTDGEHMFTLMPSEAPSTAAMGATGATGTAGTAASIATRSFVDSQPVRPSSSSLSSASQSRRTVSASPAPMREGGTDLSSRGSSSVVVGTEPQPKEVLMANMAPVVSSFSTSAAKVSQGSEAAEEEATLPVGWKAFVPTLAPPSLDQERELNFIMQYLDYVFPFLYPFYRPSLLGNGRGWLLMLLMKNKAVFHSALSLSSYFLAVVSEQQTPGSHSACKQHNAEELHKQQELSLRELQHNIGEISRRGVRGNLAESARAVESIIQLLYFEVVVGRVDSWYIHLDAALALFSQIMEHHGTAASGSGMGGDGAEVTRYSWDLVVSHLSPFRSALTASNPGENIPYTSDQAALQFYVALLLYLDILASTSMEQPPRLRKFHAALIRPPPALDHEPLDEFGSSTDVPLDMDEVVGIGNWVMLVLADVATLAAWKKDATAARTLLLAEVLERAAPIEMGLRARLACLEARMASKVGQNQQSGPFSNKPVGTGFFSGYLGAVEAHVESYQRRTDHDDATPRFGHAAHPSSEPVNLIWGYATLTYLLVLQHGWQPASSAIRQSADRTLELIAALPSSGALRTVAWPFCVTGCVAAPEQRPFFRAMVSNICGAEVFGSVNEALRIMEAVWALQASSTSTETDIVYWDFGRCFSILGRRTFLV